MDIGSYNRASNLARSRQILAGCFSSEDVRGSPVTAKEGEGGLPRVGVSRLQLLGLLSHLLPAGRKPLPAAPDMPY